MDTQSALTQALQQWRTARQELESFEGLHITMPLLSAEAGSPVETQELTAQVLSEWRQALEDWRQAYDQVLRLLAPHD